MQSIFNRVNVYVIFNYALNGINALLIVLVFVSFLCRNFSFYFVLVFWMTIILVLVF